MAADENWNIPFSQNAEKDGWLLRRLITELSSRMDLHKTLRVLDLGCGSGELSFLLAEVFPNSDVTGLDISEPNIARGRRELASRRLHRVSFICGDYSQIRFPNDHFDLVVADGVLHLIPEAARDVMPKIVGEMAPGGHLVFSIPDDGLFNRLLWLVRFVLRQCRSAITDRLILSVAKLVHGKNTSDEFLRERVNYMYITPSLWFSKKLRMHLCQNLGLVTVHKCRYPHASPGQFQHQLCIFSKPAQAVAASKPQAG
jgi:SAM-dependent methyltransferase